MRKQEGVRKEGARERRAGLPTQAQNPPFK